MRRVLLDWEAPVLPQATTWLADRTPSGASASDPRDTLSGHGTTGHTVGGLPGAIDLRDTMCVLPGRRSGRLLLWHLGQLAAERGLALLPPRVATPGDVPTVLFPSEGRQANDLERTLAWVHSLRNLGPQREIIAGPLPMEAPLEQWLALASLLTRVEDELVGEGRTFLEAAAQARELAGEAEAARWRALDAAARSAAQRLEWAGLTNPATNSLGVATAARDAVPHRVVLIGVAQLNRRQRDALARHESLGGEVVTLVHADQTWAARLDEFGCVPYDAPSWTPLSVSEEEIVVADRASDAAQSVVRLISDLDGRFGPDDVTIGLLDPDLTPALEQAADFAGRHVRLAAGRPMPSTEPWQVVAALVDWLDSPSPNPTGLARLPAGERWLRRAIGDGPRGDLLEALDREARAPRRGNRLTAADRSFFGAANAAIESLLHPWRGAERPLHRWAEEAHHLLAEVLGAVDADAVIRESAMRLAEELAAWQRLPPELAPTLPGPAALRLLARRTAEASVPEVPRADEIEALGWLELHADDAPVLLMLGLHEGRVPASAASDPFLPDALRSALGLPDDRARAARDAYLLEAARRGRALVRVVMARRSLDGEPLTASRLLLAVPPARLPGRLRRLADARKARRHAAPAGLARPARTSRFLVPQAPPGPVQLNEISVSAFRAYLACPFRYWLRFHAGLETVDPLEEELDAIEFGNLAHDALQAFGIDEAMRDETSPKNIQAFMEEAVDASLRARFGPDFRERAPASVRIQAERLKERFALFAVQQAKHRLKGWRIAEVEWTLPEDALLQIEDEAPVRVRGRIDRIDVHPEKGWLLLDYKTGERTPRKAHNEAERPPAAKWVDLQLPLYGHLARPSLVTASGGGRGVAAGDRGEDSGVRSAASTASTWSGTSDLGAPVQLGYFLLPAKPQCAGVRIADWDEDELATALETAQWVVQSIRRGRFEMNPSYKGKEFETICQTRAPADDGEVEGCDDDGEEGEA